MLGRFATGLLARLCWHHLMSPTHHEHHGDHQHKIRPVCSHAYKGLARRKQHERRK